MKQVIGLTAAAIAGMILLCSGIEAREVVVYTSLDQVFSEPVLKAYEEKSGVTVKAVYDVEAAKTTGLVNRLLAEKTNPRCDVFWNSEFGRTLVLKEQGILSEYVSPSAESIPARFRDPEGFWTGFAARARVLVYNTDLVSVADAPRSIFELIEDRWKGRVTMAYPLFGTTATQMAAMISLLGRESTDAYLKALKANDVLIVDGNSVVRDMVAAGRIPLGLTDTDDANVAIQAGKPISMIYPDHDGIGTLLIPNTVALIKGAPNGDEGRLLIDFLLSLEVESMLAHSESAQMPLRDGVDVPEHVPAFTSITPMAVDYNEVAGNMAPAAILCRDLFVR